MRTLQNKVAVITSGNSGIGFATAKELARQGDKAIITGRNNGAAVAQAARELGVEGLASDQGDVAAIDALVAGLRASVHYRTGARIVKANMEDIEEAFYQLIRKGQQQGEVTPKHDARALARFLFNTMSGLRVAAKAGAGQDVYADVVHLALSVLK
jgi:NAD(P)-dependent dehydrogenase (short-subunit alcohol dehydrogenase family)